ncbi:MAG: hypothetical protein ACFFHD_06420 [Promethearchaeota archaeon]
MNGEVIFLRLLDVGRSSNLRELASIFPRIPDKRIIKTKDTPSYVDFPKPITIEFNQEFSLKVEVIRDIKLIVKIYEDGIVSLIGRLAFTDLPLEDLHNIKKVRFYSQDGELDINMFLKFHSNKIYE